MIQPRSFADALQRSLLGLGDIGTALQDADQNKARLALLATQNQQEQAKLPIIQAEAGQKQLGYLQALKQKQLQDALTGGGAAPADATATAPKPAALPMASGASLGMSPAGMPTGIQGPSAGAAAGQGPGGAAGTGGLSDHDASLIATLNRLGGDYSSTPDMVRAKYQSGLKETQNAGTLSDQKVQGGALDIQGKQLDNQLQAGLMPFKLTEGKNTADASAYKPGQARADMRLANAKASEAESDAAMKKAMMAGQQQDAGDIAKNLVSGDLTWGEFNNLFTGRGPEAGMLKRQVFQEAKKLDPNFSPAALEQGFKAFSNIQNQKTIASVNNVKPNIDALVQLSNQAGRTSIPMINKILMNGKYQVGDKTVTNFNAMRDALSDELSVALAGQNGATDAKLALAKQLLNTDPSAANFAENMKILNHLLDVRAESVAKTMGPYGRRLVPSMGEPAAGAAGGNDPLGLGL